MLHSIVDYSICIIGAITADHSRKTFTLQDLSIHSIISCIQNIGNLHIGDLKLSALAEHTMNTDQEVDWPNATVLDSCQAFCQSSFPSSEHQRANRGQ